MMKRRLLKLLSDDSGQDILEYALLSAAIGLAGILAWQAVTGGIGTAYGGWDTGTQNLWEPDDPVGGGS